MQQNDRNFLRNVSEHVVSHLVSEDEERLRRGHVLHGRVPHDDALGRAEAGDVGVQRRGLLAGLHLEHALRRNVHAGAMHHAFDLRDQVGDDDR